MNLSLRLTNDLVGRNHQNSARSQTYISPGVQSTDNDLEYRNLAIHREHVGITNISFKNSTIEHAEIRLSRVRLGFFRLYRALVRSWYIQMYKIAGRI